MPGFCRDCLEPAAKAVRRDRCGACGSPRLTRHPELFDLAIAHIDCDAFFASVEKRDNPELVNKPLIIGGGRRGVVSTACYIARTYGVHSAMPMFKALKACPDAVVITPSHGKYSAVSRQIFAMMRNVTPLVQTLSVDEAFLDLSGTRRLHKRPPALTLAALVRDIERDIGITASIGLSHNKFLAKIASDLDKPRGFSTIGRAQTTAFLAKLPVTSIFGVGKAFERRLGKDGITTLGQIQAISESTMTARYGAMGERLAGLARGIDERPVTPHGAAKSISAETTFDRDIAEFERLETILWRLCEKVAARVKRSDLFAGGLTLKLKTARFRIVTRSRRLAEPTQLADTIFQNARELLRAEATGTAYRLIGIGVAHLSAEPERDVLPNLVDRDSAARARAERAIDKVRDKFGTGAINKGRALRDRET